MSVTIKTSFTTPRGDVDTRRFQLLASSERYAQLHAFLDSTYGRLYGLSALSSQYALSYVDPDGDECSINSELELQEAIRCAAEDNKTLKVKVKTEDAVHISRPSSVASSRADEPSASASFNSATSQPGRGQAVEEEDEYVTIEGEGSSQPAANSATPVASVAPVTAAFKSISLSSPQPEEEEQKEEQKVQPIASAPAVVVTAAAAPASSVTVQDVTQEEREEDALLAAIIDSTKQATAPATAQPEATPSTEEAVHHGIVCDGCNMSPIVGVRYKSLSREDFDLCSACEASGKYPSANGYIKMTQPRSANHWWRSGGGGGHGHHGFGGGHGGHHFGHGMGGRFGGRHGGWHHRRAAEAQAQAAATSGYTTGDAAASTSAPFHGCRWADQADRPKAAFIGDVTLADGITVKPGQILQKVWQVRNTGDKPWPAGTRLQFIGGDVTPFTQGVAAGATGADASWSDAAVVPVAQPGQIINLALDIQVPQQLGRFRGTFRLITAEGVRFGPRIWIDLEVSDSESTTTEPASAAASAPTDGSAAEAQTEGNAASQQPQTDPRTAIHQAVQSVLTALGSAGNGNSNPLHTLATAFQSAASSIQQHASAAAERVSSARQPTPFPYPAELEQIRALGLQFDEERIKALLLRYRGRVDRTVNELFKPTVKLRLRQAGFCQASRTAGMGAGRAKRVSGEG